MEYNFKEIEEKWQRYWAEHQTFNVTEDITKPKYYVLDMFPYPSGAGLHVGHPIGYIASDIYARYKRLTGYNVLHPMGYDAFGLPAEQYAIQTGQHPEKTTNDNIKRYRGQLDRMGFSFAWDREVRTCDPEYYKWTQWAFITMFNSWYDNELQRARPIEELIQLFETRGNTGVNAACGNCKEFSQEDWNLYSERKKSSILMQYRIAYLGESTVNWCPKLGTVLANDEVKDGFSERGGFPVYQKTMKQWQLRVSAYAERLLMGLDSLDWSDSLKEMQRNWIGRSEGAEIDFKVQCDGIEQPLTIFTTRPETIFGVTFIVLAPESEWVNRLTSASQKAKVDAYISSVNKKTERERIIGKSASGVFSGAYGVHPITGEIVPIWISEYVLSNYGTGAIMAVPAHDSRDYLFAKKYKIPIIPIIEGACVDESAYEAKEGLMSNSGFLNGLSVKDAIPVAINHIEKNGIGKRKVYYRIRDAIFSRQRYWGEPFPIYYKNGIATPLPLNSLPLTLPEVDQFKPTEDGQPPLARAKNWNFEGYPLETSTMPGFAGSSAYYLRYMDPNNHNCLVSKKNNDYWGNVDLYIGGAEHAAGHLIYARFWNKLLYDLGYICKDEPFQKLINQGMIQGRSSFVYLIPGTNTFVSAGLKDNYDTIPVHVDISLVHNDKLDIEAFKQWRPEYKDATLLLEENEYICGWAVEKMSKSMYNVVTPDAICDTYGADTLRLYEMFMGPLEQSKPWDTKGIDGVHRFLRKFWRLFYRNGDFIVDDSAPTSEDYKTLHKLIGKVKCDMEELSFNTTVSAFMIAVNDLYERNVTSKSILEPLVIMVSPFAPHIAEELWQSLGHSESVAFANFPDFDETLALDEISTYAIQFNGKVRFIAKLPKNLDKESVAKQVVDMEDTKKYLSGMTIIKVVVVPSRIVNFVIKPL